MCPHMKKISLRNIYQTLETMEPEIVIPEEIAAAARRSVQRMLEIS